MGRRDYLNDPDAAAANSVVPSAVAAVRNETASCSWCTDNGRWALPGGGHDIGETVGDTAVREVREETGIGGTLRTSDESLSIAWVGPERRDELDIHLTTRLRINHALLGPATPYIG